MRARAAATLSLVAIMAIGLLLLSGGGAAAKNQPDFLPAFEATYPGAVGSRIDACTLCHDIDGNEHRLNQYAKQWKEDENFTAINNLDADGDGYTNLQEIQAHTFPGNAADNPSTVLTTTTIPGATTTTAPAGSGGAIYQANCASCHGDNGGNLVPSPLSLAQIINVTGNGSGGMPGFSGSLTGGEIQSVSEYIFNWAPAPTTTTTTVPGATTTTAPPPNGQSLYGTSCAGCHGANGGDPAGTTLSHNQLVAVITDGTTTGMPAYSSSHTAAEIGALADYLLSLAPPPPATTTTTTPGTPPPPPPSGATVYSSNCAGCHGASGGNLVGRTITSGRISSAVVNGTTGMPGYAGTLSQAEIDAVVAYVAGQTAVSPTTTTTAPGSPPPDGATVFADSCAACHGTGGGDLVGHSLTDGELSSVTVGGTGSMPAFGSRLSSAQVDAVVAYLSTLGTGASATAGPAGADDGPALYIQHCAACHGAHGVGGLYGPVAGTSLGRSNLMAVTASGRGSMPGYAGRMTADEIGAVADFVLALGTDDAAPGDDPVSGESADPDEASADAGDPVRVLSRTDPIEAGLDGSPILLVVLILSGLSLAGGLGYVWWRAARGLVG